MKILISDITKSVGTKAVGIARETLSDNSEVYSVEIWTVNVPHEKFNSIGIDTRDFETALELHEAIVNKGVDATFF